MEHSEFGETSIRSGRSSARTRSRGLRRALSVFLAGLFATGLCGRASAGFLDADPVVPDKMENPLEAVRYADAMADCAGRILETLVIGCDLVPAELEQRHSFWIWRSEAGATVNRTLGGEYRIRTGDCLGGFCRWYSCRVSKWPVLTCSDGGTLKAHVPDQSHFNLGGTDYVRVRALQQSPR
ncbi:MAG: hypothetical protein Kow0026_01930 [Oricola sp.]